METPLEVTGAQQLMQSGLTRLQNLLADRFTRDERFEIDTSRDREAATEALNQIRDGGARLVQYILDQLNNDFEYLDDATLAPFPHGDAMMETFQPTSFGGIE